MNKFQREGHEFDSARVKYLHRSWFDCISFVYLLSRKYFFGSGFVLFEILDTEMCEFMGLEITF